MKIVIDQDRENMYHYDEYMDLDIIRVQDIKGNIYGYNLMVDDCMLGTFDTEGEAMLEVYSLVRFLNSDDIIYEITGYSGEEW